MLMKMYIFGLLLLTLSVDAATVDTTRYQCIDRKFVKKVEDCIDSDYKTLLNDVLGEDLVCDDDAAIYRCGYNGTCASHTNECGCLDGLEEWNGYCYPSTANPITLIDKKKVDCDSLIKMVDESAEPVVCQDGTCRSSEDECNTEFECPLGFKACGVKCILLWADCNEEVPTCPKGEVLCWDLTCAKGYTKCPTRMSCPKGKVLCPDKTCQDKGHCLQPDKRTCGENEYQCPDFSCVESKSECKKNTVCGLGKSLCEDGECRDSCQEVVKEEEKEKEKEKEKETEKEPEKEKETEKEKEKEDNKFLCPNGEYVDDPKDCPENTATNMIDLSDYIKCPSGGYAVDSDSCKFIQKRLAVTCPSSKQILCPDYECVRDDSECSKYIPRCPNHKPYQCWDNTCRTSFDECPTPPTCPSGTVLCQNGLCASSANGCAERKTDTCTQYKCFDGTCVSSMELCPTLSVCGEGAIKCWNGACVNKIDECRKPITTKCSGDLNYMCPDGTCRRTANDCGTTSVCPPHLPVKCFDNSCRASLAECPKFQTCGENKVSCPDGTCALKYEECNTIVTCPFGHPFLCYDNTCKTMLSDCAEPPKCSNHEVLCPNGACVSSRQNCKIFEPCESTYPVRCEKNTCTDDYNKCLQKDKKCPMGYIMCENGDCKTSEYLCDKFECPKNKPYRCKEGVCVHDKELCDNPENGCPYNAKFRCPDGTCVADMVKCAPEKSFTCKEGQKKCVDGSCIKENLDCPLINGCYKNRPFKCADGTCINPETTTCPLVFCPYNYPYKCPNGYCVAKSSDCPKELSDDDLKDCGKGLIMCVDGRCVVSSDYCRPAFRCETGYELCADRSCRIGIENCPQHTKCPAKRPISCPDTHICVKNEDECISSGLVCPDGYHKCSTDGLCVANSNYCQPLPYTDASGCLNGGVKCPNGRCVASFDLCSKVSNACPDDDAPFLCSNGECSSDSKCTASANSVKCDGGKTKCATGRCVSNTVTDVLSKCGNDIGCPLDKPYRCANGVCAHNERNCHATSSKDGGLTISISCDVSKPYLCADKSCVADPKFCKSYSPCSGGKKNCYNGYCVDSSASCNQFADFCPVANPIQCPAGNCVDDIMKCSTPFPVPVCGEGEFYCSRLNKCLVKKLDCLVYLDVKKKEKVTTRRLLENFADPLADENFINMHNQSGNTLKSFADDANKKTDGTICWDGTIAKGNERCPVVPICKIGQYRCENGGCATDLKDCYVDKDYVCTEGQKKCPDGLCHEDCNEVFFHGCEVGKYQCSNGKCVEDRYDCIGHSMCPDVLFPFRCISGECKSTPEECELVERLGNVKKITYSFNKASPVEFSFAYDYNKRPIGKLEIPSYGLKLAETYSQIYVEEVPSSVINIPNLYNKTTELIFNVSNSIYSSEGVITFENSVLSPVFKVYSKDANAQFQISGNVKMAHNEYEADGLLYYDYCLGKLNGYNMETDSIPNYDENVWECVDRQTVYGQTEFKISDFGVYAVILNPLRNKINYFGTTTEKNFFVENIKYILIFFAIIILLCALIFYIFVRVTRYRQKLHENRAKILLLQQQKQEYENMTTDIFGQTLGDNINGIVYKANPAYTVTDDIKKSGTSLEEEIEKLQIECRNVNDQNERLQKDIADITDEYKTLSASIENMNK